MDCSQNFAISLLFGTAWPPTLLRALSAGARVAGSGGRRATELSTHRGFQMRPGSRPEPTSALSRTAYGELASQPCTGGVSHGQRSKRGSTPAAPSRRHGAERSADGPGRRERDFTQSAARLHVPTRDERTASVLTLWGDGSIRDVRITQRRTTVRDRQFYGRKRSEL